jgi:hypothetical protein
MLLPGGKTAYKVLQLAATGTGNGTAAECTIVSDGGFTTLTVQITGISGDTITFEGTVDGSNWVAFQFTNLNTGTAATTATADGLYRATVLGLKSVRARVSTWSAGTITITGYLVA